MTETVIVGILSLLGTIIGSLLGIRQSNKLSTYQIKELQKRVDKHNNVLERMTRVEESTKSAHKRIDEFERGGH